MRDISPQSPPNGNDASEVASGANAGAERSGHAELPSLVGGAAEAVPADRPTERQTSARRLELDEWVRQTHASLTFMGAITNSIELCFGVILLVIEWDREGNYTIRVFLAMRLMSYAYLVWSTWQEYHDFEPSHPGFQLPWTVVHVICVVTLVAAAKHAFRNWQSRFMVATALVDVGLLIITWWFLRRCRRIVNACISRGEVKGIHQACSRYLDFIPPADRGKDYLSARHLLWEAVQVFEDVREEIAGRGAMSCVKS